LDQEIIILCIRWYLRFKLSFRDLVEMMAEPEVSLAQNPSVANSRISLSLFLERYPSGRYASIVPHSSGKTLSA